jgi:AcrR family transcriptional regulator
MSPRRYSMDKRQIAADEMRARILEAARQLLASDAVPDLSMEAVARRADVSRLTIYYRFKSRRGLLEALYDYLAQRGQMNRMAEVFQEADTSAALSKMVHTFVRFWSTDPRVMRRLRAMAALDREIARGVRERDSRRQHIAREILKRGASSKEKAAGQIRMSADALSLLTSFEAYDALASAGHGQEDIIAVLTHLARALKTGRD